MVSQAMNRSADRRPDSTRAEVGIIASLALLSLAFFVVFPRFDVAVSGWFYEPGVGFAWGGNNIVRTLYIVGLWIPRLALVMLLISVIASLFVRKGWLHVHRLRMVFLFVAGTLSVGVAVNALLKEHWGRARPVAIAEFGGTARYTPPYEISAQCRTNCAFTSGHAAGAFALLALGRLRSINIARARRRWLAIGLIAGMIFGLARIAQGAHFLSDVLFSFFIVYAVIEVVDRVFQWILSYNNRSSESTDDQTVGAAATPLATGGAVGKSADR
ncbi:MAG: phosphatase PAP2 family protein [Burkholderiaceae bacterium]